jgi:hypothetical protein
VRGLLDWANWLMVGYPLAGMLALWLWPDITAMVFVIGAVIGVPLFLLQDRGEQPMEGRGSAWFQVIMVGVSFAWPFIIFTLLRFLKRRKAGSPERDEPDQDAH